jgi:hypothetical protein
MRTRSWKTAVALFGAMAVVVPACAAHAAPGSGPTDIRPQVTYYRLIAQHSTKCLDLNGGSQEDGAAIIQWTCYGWVNQQVTRIYPPRGFYYALVVAQSGKCLIVRDDSLDDGAEVTQVTCDPPSGHMYAWYDGGGLGYYPNTIISAHSNKCLDVRDASLEDGARIQQWTCHGHANQQWLFRE